ncbi:mitochondrial carrier domain-containing protein [Globomyces pollinis-pini]|nr:mitochondrial carrier domain-containing protein [Globomyces pollinis-pini]
MNSSRSSIFFSVSFQLFIQYMQRSFVANDTIRPRDWHNVQRLGEVLYQNQNQTRDRPLKPTMLAQHMFYSFTKYSSVIMVVPFSNALTLKQVQFLPSIDNESSNQNQEPEADEQQDNDDISSLDPYLDISHKQNKQIQSNLIPTDATGYLLRTNTGLDDPTRPPYQLPSIENDGTTSIISKIAYLNDEGFSSIWKGHQALFYREWISSWLQPTIQKLLWLPFESEDSLPMPMVHLTQVQLQFSLLVLSHTIAGMILSPLELIQTRLIVQTSNKTRKKYTSTLNALSTIIAEEYPSTPFSIVFSPNLFVPSLLYHTLNPLFQHSTPIVADRLFGVGLSSPRLYIFTEFGINLLELIVMLPIETVRKRLQCQSIQQQLISEETLNFETVVDVSPIPYTGYLDCIYRILTEEGIRRKKTRKDSWGIRGLYRGFRARLMTNIMVAILQLLTHIIDEGES